MPRLIGKGWVVNGFFYLFGPYYDGFFDLFGFPAKYVHIRAYMYPRFGFQISVHYLFVHSCLCMYFHKFIFPLIYSILSR